MKKIIIIWIAGVHVCYFVIPLVGLWVAVSTFEAVMHYWCLGLPINSIDVASTSQYERLII
jgi:hypothetical protein